MTTLNPAGTATIDLAPYTSQLEKWLEETQGRHTAMEAMKRVIDAIKRMIERLIARVCHLCGVAYNGLTTGARGEVAVLKSIEVDPQDESPAASEHRAGAPGLTLAEAITAVDRQIKHLVEHITTGDVIEDGDFEDPERLDAMLQDLARSRADYGEISNKAKAEIDRHMAPLLAQQRAIHGQADEKALLSVLRAGPENAQAKLIDREGLITRPLQEHASAMERVRNLEIAAHALIEEAGSHSPALQMQLKARALELMPGALEFLNPASAGDTESVQLADSTSESSVHEAGTHPTQFDAQKSAVRDTILTGKGSVVGEVAGSNPSSDGVAKVAAGFARFAKQVNLSELVNDLDAIGVSEVKLPKTSVFQEVASRNNVRRPREGIN